MVGRLCNLVMCLLPLVSNTCCKGKARWPGDKDSHSPVAAPQHPWPDRLSAETAPRCMGTRSSCRELPHALQGSDCTATAVCLARPCVVDPEPRTVAAAGDSHPSIHRAAMTASSAAMRSTSGRALDARVSRCTVVALVLCLCPTSAQAGSQGSLSDGAGGMVSANVRDFGAQGDGVTDDIEAIEAALASLNGTGGIVLLPAPGQYAVSRPLVVSGYAVTIRGTVAHPAGCGHRGSSLLSLTGNSTVIALISCTFCTVSNLLLSHAVSGPAHGHNADETCAEAMVLLQQARRRRHPAQMAGQHTGMGGRHLDATYAADSRRFGQPRIAPAAGASIVLKHTFQVTLAELWISGVWEMVRASDFANTITILDSQLSDAYGPCGICASGGGDNNGTRVDIVQISRITANNNSPGANRSTVWIDIGAGVNTVRLDNVGLINGGVGVRMDSPQDSPAGLAPGRPLFLLANDLEIDFPSGNAVELLAGEDAQISNSYIQGAGATVSGPARLGLGVGLLVGARWNSEVLVTNTRFFGHALSAVELRGGAHTMLTNNIIGASSIRSPGTRAAVLVRSGVSDFIIQGNHIGNVFRSQSSTGTSWGVQVEPGSSDRYLPAPTWLSHGVMLLYRDAVRGVFVPRAARRRSHGAVTPLFMCVIGMLSLTTPSAATPRVPWTTVELASIKMSRVTSAQMVRD